MEIEIERVTDSEAAAWNEYAAHSPAATPFHRYEALDLLAREADATLHPLVGFMDHEPVGLLPLFELTKGPFRLVVSPPALEVFTLGPTLLTDERLTQRTKECRHRRFIEASLDWLDQQLDPASVDIRTSARYTDLRPFLWRGYDVSPAYTYVVDLTPTEDELLLSFSRDARRTIREREDEAATIHQSGSDGIASVLSRIRTRYTAQGSSYPLTPRFVEALYDRLPGGVMRVYTVQADSKPGGGMVTLEHGDTVYRWQGGANPGGTGPATESLDWRIMRDAKARGLTRYDLVGANRPRLCRYKAKFNPTPVPYYVVQRQSSWMRAAVATYHRLPTWLRVV